MSIALASYEQWALPPSAVRGLSQASAGLALGSAFWHGSNTELGGEADTVMIAVMAYIMQQASMEHLPTHMKTPVLSDLSLRSRATSGVGIAQLLTDMYRTQPNNNWLETLTTLDIPSYETSFAALITSLLTILFPQPMVEPTASTLIDIFGIDAPTKKFILEAYIPQARQAFTPIRISALERLDLFLATVTTVKKLIYAFLFQEITFDIQFLKSPLATQVYKHFQKFFNFLTFCHTQLGALFQPLLNSKSGIPSSLPQLSPRLTSGKGNNLI